MFYKKIISYFKSWKKINLDNDFSCIIFGGQAANQRLYFAKNYCLVDPLHHNIYNFNLVFHGIIFFVSYFVKNPIFYFKLIKFWPTIFFVLAFIKKKKIKILLSLVDYNPWPIYFKKILKDEVYTLTIQNSARHYPVNRMKYLNAFDEYFLWNELGDDEFQQYAGKTKMLKFGAFKSYYSIEKNAKWQFIKEYPEKTGEEKLFLISSFTDAHYDFYKKHFYHLDINQYLDEMNMDKFRQKNLSLIELQCLEYLYLCMYMKSFVEKKKIVLNIIEKYELSNPFFKEEKFFFNKIFSNYTFLKKGVDEKIDKILENKNAIYFTNISNLGRECLTLNLKTLFFSKWLHKYNPNFFQRDHIFFSIEENEGEFKEKIEKILQMNSTEFEKNKNMLKKSILSCPPTKDKLKYFFEVTGLKFKYDE